MSLGPISICKNGEEKYEKFIRKLGRKVQRLVQYEFRDSRGELFACVKPTLEACRTARDKWLDERKGRYDTSN